MKISACIFDLDGVIVDTAKHHLVAWNKMANQFGYELSQDDNEKLKGVSRMGSLEIILGLAGVDVSDEEKIELARQKNEWYVEMMSQITKSEILPGVENFLDELDNHEIKIALGSASKNAPIILEKIGLFDRFEVIIDGNSTVKSKPDPEVFLKGAEGLGVLPSESVVFEDSSKGIDAAKTGGFLAVGIGEKSNLEHADLVIQGFQDFSFSDLESQILR